MREVHGNFWDQKAEAHVITTNGIVRGDGQCVMGRGIALEAKNRFPGIAMLLGARIKEHGNKVHPLGEWARADGTVFNMLSFPVKKHWHDRASVDLITQSFAELLLETSGYQSIVIVRPGCGNGGLLWKDILPIAKQFLNDRFTVVERRT